MSYLLLTYSSQIKGYLRSGSARSLEAAIVAQKNFWQLMGIMVILYLVAVLLMVMFIVAGAGAAVFGMRQGMTEIEQFEEMESDPFDQSGMNAGGIDNGGLDDFGSGANLNGGGLPGTNDNGLGGSEVEAPGFDPAGGSFDLNP